MLFSCRTILAALHFNYNVNRDAKLDALGKPKLSVSYQKFKDGEGTVREVKTPQNYGTFVNTYIIIQLFIIHFELSSRLC